MIPFIITSRSLDNIDYDYVLKFYPPRQSALPLTSMYQYNKSRNNNEQTGRETFMEYFSLI